MSNDLVVTEQTPARLLELAVQQNLDVEKLGKLMELHKQWKADLAREAFYQAMAQFQAQCPRLEKRKRVAYGDTEYFYTPLPDMVEQLREPLRAAGLSYRWQFVDVGEQLSATFIVTHTAGHSEQTTMTAPADASGKKNAVQQRGSTITYLQRYTMIGGLGISTADTDIDARLSHQAITDEQTANIEALIGEVKADKAKFLKFMSATSVADIRAPDYGKAVKALEQKRKAA